MTILKHRQITEKDIKDKSITQDKMTMLFQKSNSSHNGYITFAKEYKEIPMVVINNYNGGNIKILSISYGSFEIQNSGAKKFGWFAFGSH